MTTRFRQKNVHAAQWSSNGEALGTLDLTEEDNNVFAANVFSPAVQKERLKLLQGYMDKGVGWVNLHYAVDYDPKHGETVVGWPVTWPRAMSNTIYRWTNSLRIF